MTTFKEEQGMLCIFCIVLFIVLWQRGSLKKQSLFVASLVLGVLVVCPLTAVALLKVFTPFYDWTDLQLIWPITLLVAFGGVEAVYFLKSLEIPGLRIRQIAKTMISIFCVAFVLLVATNFHGLDRRTEANKDGVPVEVAEVYDSLYEMVGAQPLVLAAPSSMLQYTRLYETAWQPLYGRDLWSGKAASYINSGYEAEYEYYSLLEENTLLPEEHLRLTELINEQQTDCVIVPIYWPSEMGNMPGYETVDLNRYYAAIIKKDLIIE